MPPLCICRVSICDAEAQAARQRARDEIYAGRPHTQEPATTAGCGSDITFGCWMNGIPQNPSPFGPVPCDQRIHTIYAEGGQK